MLPLASTNRHEIRQFTMRHPCPSYMCDRYLGNSFGESVANRHSFWSFQSLQVKEGHIIEILVLHRPLPSMIADGFP